MRISYDSRRDCNCEMAWSYAKCLLGTVGIALAENISDEHPWLRAIVGGVSIGYVFHNAARWGAIGQIRGTCYPKEGK